jgi:diguanylate cyclase (GGDEF)-like protein/PAS domain S-box-containing protein
MTPRDGILILDAERAIIEEANPFVTELLGYSREELLGRSFRDLGCFGDRAKGAALFEKVERRGFVRCDRLPLKARDGDTVFVEFVGNSYLVDERKVIQFNVRGISEQRGDEEAQPPETAEFDSLQVLRLGHAVQLEVSSLLETITEHARILTRADATELFLCRSERDVLERAHVAGASVCGAIGDVRPGEGLTCKVWETGKCVLLAGKECPFRRALGAPIRWRRELLGVLASLSNREESFSESDTGLLDILAGQAAVAIINSRLSEEIEHLAVVDELTGVFNRRGLVILGAREVERARRLGRPLAALFVDLDHFKSLNDEYSHEVGDQALREVSRRIHNSMRSIDTVARYGGEEFVVLLVETELGSAVEVGERVRQVVEATSLATGRGTARLTVSVGVTANGPKTRDLESLIRRADEAMYAAKQRGRNRVVALEG